MFYDNNLNEIERMSGHDAAAFHDWSFYLIMQYIMPQIYVPTGVVIYQ